MFEQVVPGKFVAFQGPADLPDGELYKVSREFSLHFSMQPKYILGSVFFRFRIDQKLRYSEGDSGAIQSK